MKKALFVIDVQNAFINKKTNDLPGKLRLYIGKNKDSYGLIIFTRFINTPTSGVFRFLGWKKSMNSPETDIVPGLRSLLRYGIVFPKDVLSALKIPEIPKLLTKHHIQALDICGIDTDCCVLATAFDAFDQGYRTVILDQLTMSHGGIVFHDAAMRIFKRNLKFTEQR